MVAEFTSEFVDFRPTPSPLVSLQAVELEEAVLEHRFINRGTREN